MLLLQLTIAVSVLVQGIVCPLWLWNGRNRDHGLMLPPLRIPEHLATDKITWATVDMKVDHFNDSDTRTWKQRYLMNPIFGVPGGPGFLQFGGEGAASDGFLQTANGTILMDWMKNAKKYNATAFILEHRYYGESIPVQGAGNDPQKMIYLSSRQALADTADFIKWASEEYNLKKWIVFGGSYSGALSAWMRLLYPDIVVGAISSSGPVEAQVQYSDYYKVAGDDLQKYDPKCYQETKKAFQFLETLVKGNQTVRDSLGHQIDLCHAFDPKDENDLSAVFDSLSGPYMTTAQYGGDNRPPYDTTSIPNLCKVIMDTETYPNYVDRLLAVGRFVTGQDNHYGGNWDCIDNSYNEQIRSLKEMNSQRCWQWQCCTEFGFFQTTDAPTQPFGNHSPLDKRMQICQDVFGLHPDGVSHMVDATNAYYGGQKNYNGTNVIIINGSQDPWYTLGVWDKKWERPGQTIVLMDGQAHCSNMYPARVNDTQAVIDVRNQITEHIGRWLKEAS